MYDKKKKRMKVEKKNVTQKKILFFFLIKNAFKYFYFKMQFTKVKPPGKKYANFI